MKPELILSDGSEQPSAELSLLRGIVLTGSFC